MPAPRRVDARTLLFEKIRTSEPKFVHVTGVPYGSEEPPQADADKVDPLWITLEVPPFGRLRVVVNTHSLAARDAGLDARIHVAVVSLSWTDKPPPALSEDPGQDYAKIAAAFPVTYVLMEREPLTALLTERAKKAVRIEVWGELFATETLGVRQVHSRRASTARPSDIRNRDGALKFYYADENAAELFLFKFDGQP
jgi:hypothetical protein